MPRGWSATANPYGGGCCCCNGPPRDVNRPADAASMFSRWLNGYMVLTGLPKAAISHRTPLCPRSRGREKSAATNQPGQRVDSSSSVNTAAAIENPHTTTAYVVYRSELRSCRSLLPRFSGQITASGRSLVCRCFTMPDSMYDNILQSHETKRTKTMNKRTAVQFRSRKKKAPKTSDLPSGNIILYFIIDCLEYNNLLLNKK